MRTVVRNSYTPQIGDYCNKIVVDQDNGVQYIFDSDGVYSVYTSKQQEGAPMFYVDSAVNAAKNELRTFATTKDAEVLAEAKAYTDEHGGTGGVTKAYVDAQDAATLQAAKDYTDEHGGGSEAGLFFITVASINDTNHTFTTDKTYAEAFEAYESGKLLVLKYVPIGVDDGEYAYIPLDRYMDSDEATGFRFRSSYTSGSDNRIGMSYDSFFLSRYSNLNTYYHGYGGVEIDSSLNQYSHHAIENSAVATALQAKADASSVPVITIQSSDPGEGALLAANNFIAVYLEESE